MKTYLIFLLIISGLFYSCKREEKRYRIEQYFYINGKNYEGKMWNDSKKINSNTYIFKLPDHSNPNTEFDSVVFKIVEEE